MAPLTAITRRIVMIVHSFRFGKVDGKSPRQRKAQLEKSLSIEALDLPTDVREGAEQGLANAKAGKTVPWKQLKKEARLGD